MKGIGSIAQFSQSISLDSTTGPDELAASALSIPNIRISPPTPQTATPMGSHVNISVINRNQNSQKSWKDADKVESDTSKHERCQLILKRWFRRKNMQRVFPIIKWLPEYNVSKLISDTIAGITVALTCLPQSIAYAALSGLPPQYGLYSSFVGPFVYIIFGSTNAVTIGPAAIQSILTYKYTESKPKPEEYATVLCFIVGIFTLFMGIFRLGFIANFISAPVISAFTSAVALTIIATQLKPLLGITFHDEGFLATLYGLADNIDQIKKPDAFLSLSCCVILILMKYLQKIFGCLTKNSPRVNKALWLLSVAKSALVMVCSTLLASHWHPDQPFTIVGHVSPGLPAFKLPPLEIFDPADNSTHTFVDIMREEGSALFVVPLLTVISHCTIAKVFSGTERVDAGQEILVLGIVSCISCFFSSMPIGGSFSRTTVNAQSGVQTPAGGLLTGIIVILALQYLTPYFYFIPKASLAAVICVSCFFMINPFILYPLWKSKKMDLIPWAVTFLMTLFAGLEYGITIGILLSAMFLLFYSARPRVKVGTRQTPKGTVFINILLDRSLTFPSVDYISNQIIKCATNWGNTETPIIINCQHIQYCDYTAAEGIRDLIVNMHNLGYKILFWKVKPSVFRVITGIMIHSDVPFLRCNTEEELEAVIDGVQRRLTIFHPLGWTLHVANPLKNSQQNSSKASSGAVTSAVSTGVFI